MSAYGITEYQLFCNGRMTCGGELVPCGRAFKTPADYAGHMRPAALRKTAAAEGWTHVRSALGRRFDDDYCPDHKPAGNCSPRGAAL